MMPSKLMSAILDFVDATDLPIVPCVKGKMSLIPYGKATRDIRVIRSWGKRMRFAPALPAGPITGVSVIDCGVGTLDKFLDMCAAAGEGDSLVHQTTPSGGTHFFYRHNPDVGNAVMLLGHDIDVISREKHVMLYLDTFMGDMSARPTFPAWVARILLKGGLS